VDVVRRSRSEESYELGNARCVRAPLFYAPGPRMKRDPTTTALVPPLEQAMLDSTKGHCLVSGLS